MNSDPNLAVVSLVARALGSLRDEFMLVGGCAVGLLITDQARPPVRPTVDVDLVAEIASITDYYSLRPRLNETGFKEDLSDEHMCRWRKGELILDVMPTTDVLGHSVNRWYAKAVKASLLRSLPGGEVINVISAPYFIATKLESFNSRGSGSYLHHDMEDILNLDPAVGRARAGRHRVRWQGARTRQARACKDEQRRQRARGRPDRVCSALT